jgi:type IV pilus assembly protein PilM
LGLGAGESDGPGPAGAGKGSEQVAVAAQSIIGLDIGTARIKFAELRLTRGGPEVVSLGIAPTPKETISNGVIVDPGTLAAAIRELLSSNGARARSVVSSVAGSSLVVRTIELPRMTSEELASTMRWEVERHIPFAASEVVMDYQPLIPPEEVPAEAQNMEVLLAVAQEDMINAHLETLQAAGLEPVAIDVEPLSACRSLIDINQGQGSYEQVIALLNVGATATDLSIFRNGLLSFTRTVYTAGDALTNAIGEHLGCDFVEAEQMKEQEGRLFLEAGAPALAAGEAAAPPPAAEAAPTPPQPEAAGEEPSAFAYLPEEEEEEGKPRRVVDLEAELAGSEAEPERPSFEMPTAEPRPAPPPPSGPSLLPTARVPGAGSPERRIYEAMVPTLAEMVTEIRRTLEFYTSQHPDSRVDKLIVFGGTSRLPDFEKFLANEIGLTTELADPFSRIPILGNPDADTLRQAACFLPVAVGLGIRDMLE